MDGLRRRITPASIALLTIALLTTASSPARATDDLVVRIERFVDRSRTTPAVRAADIEARPTRTLRTKIWAPDGGGPYPLVVFAHGCDGSAEPYEPLFRTWVDAGYVVAAPDFPITSKDTDGHGCIADVESQPGDVSFVITRILHLDQARNGLGGIVDRERVGVVGHSYGGLTVLALGYRSCCHDPRIGAVASFAGAPSIRGTDFAGVETPLLLIHGDSDPVVPYRGSVDAFERAHGARFLLTIVDGDHGSYIVGRDRVSRAVRRTTVAFWDAFLGDDGRARATLARGALVPGRTTMQEAG